MRIIRKADGSETRTANNNVGSAEISFLVLDITDKDAAFAAVLSEAPASYMGQYLKSVRFSGYDQHGNAEFVANCGGRASTANTLDDKLSEPRSGNYFGNPKRQAGSHRKSKATRAAITLWNRKQPARQLLRGTGSNQHDNYLEKPESASTTTTLRNRKQPERPPHTRRPHTHKTPPHTQKKRPPRNGN